MDNLRYCLQKITGIKPDKLVNKNIQDLLQRPRTFDFTKTQIEKLEHISNFIRLYNTCEFLNEKTSIDSSSKAGVFCINLFENITDKEHFYLILLNNQNEIIDTRLMSTGTISETAVYPREIIKDVLNYNASKVILAHNHPCEFLTPSNPDIEVTKKIKIALETIQVKLIDHIICTPSRQYTSMAERGLL